MTPINGETRLPGRVCQCLEPCLICCGNATTDTPKIQPPPCMGSAMRAFLRRYADDLRPYAEHGDRVALAMLESCDFLLIEADRQERGRQ